MSYLWKGDTESRHRDGIKKMDAFQKNFQDQLGSDYQFYESGMCATAQIDKKKQKRFRSAFTTRQIALLEKEFKKDPYVTNLRREQVAQNLNLPERAVKIWFQNRRMKEKRDSCKGFDVEHLDPKISTPDDTIKKISAPTNQKTTPTSLAAKIVYTDDIEPATKNDDRHSTPIRVKPSHVENLAEKYHQNASQIMVKKERVTVPPTTKVETITKVPIETVVSNTSDTKNNAVFSTEKPTPLNQTVGHVLPFSQVSTEPQKSPQILKTAATVRTDPDQQNVQPEPKVPDLIPPYPSVPIDLSKYYTPVPPVPHLPWNRINFVPVMPGTHGIPYFGSPQGISPAPANLVPVKKCSCDCHLSSLETLRAQQPMFYTPYVPHFITSVPTPHSHPDVKY